MARWEGPRRWWDREYPTFAERMRERRFARREARDAERDFPRRFAARRFAERRFDRDFSDEDFARDEAFDRRDGMSREEADREDAAMREMFGFDDEADMPPRFDRWRGERPRFLAERRPFARAFDEEGPIARIVRRVDPEMVGRFIERFADARRGVDVDVDVGRDRAWRDRHLWEGWDSPREAAEPSRDVAREPARERDADRGRDSFEDTERSRDREGENE